MENKIKRFLSLALVLMLLVGMMAFGASAEETEAATKTIYFQNNWLWTEVSIYFFDANNTYIGTAWPGAAMGIHANDGNYDVYVAEVPANAAGIVISGIKNDGSGNRDKTPDIVTWDNNQLFYMQWDNGNQVNSTVHSYTDGICTCGVACPHGTWNDDGTCAVCGAICDHEWGNDAICDTCGITCSHDWSNRDGNCLICPATCAHTYTEGKCTNCGAEDPDFKGAVAGGFIMNATGDSYICSEIKGLNATESVVLTLHDANDTLLATTTLQKPEYYTTSPLTVKFCIADTSSSWTTVWEEGKCHENFVPTTIKLYVDGEYVNSTDVHIWDQAETPLEWYKVKGVTQNPRGGEIVGYISKNRIWGETWSNATQSYEVKLYSDSTYMGSTSLNNIDGIIDGDVSVTWHISYNIAADNDEYWTQTWEISPSLDQMPNKVELWVDGVMVSEGAVNAYCPDMLSKIVAFVTDSEGYIKGAYATVEDALNAVQDGETIALIDGAVGDEAGTEMEFTKPGTYTITGNAPEYALPVITFQNATVNIKDAEILIPELDARQNATINVIDSIVHDAGGNSIVKSYYNGAINISGESVVYTMQVTTMGYITISDTAKLHATWQTNVYGNGMIVVEDEATFATAALHLTGMEYSGRDNTDADRVGMPATIVVDRANFIVGKVFADNGAEYSYNSSKGINIGTIEGKAAVLDIKDGANVNIYMANGETANVGADGTVNVAGSTFTVSCRGEGNVTLKNSGIVYVSGTSDIAANVSGEGWVYMNGVNLDADTVLTGACVAFINGENNVVGSTINKGLFNVGIGKDTYAEAAAEFAEANGFDCKNVTVNVSENAVIGASGGDYRGWVGSAYHANKEQFKYVLNIENSAAEFGYLHVSLDGTLKVTGSVADEDKLHNASEYNTFYCGTLIVNGVATLEDVDARVQYGRISVDNTTNNPGVLNIVNGADVSFAAEGSANTALTWWNSGIVYINDATVSARTPSITATGALNLTKAIFTTNEAISNPGIISLDAFSKLTAAEMTGDGKVVINAVGVEEGKDVLVIDLNGDVSIEGRTTVNNLGDAGVTYGDDGDVTFHGPVYVAQNATTEKKYTSLKAALEAAADGDTIKLISDPDVAISAAGIVAGDKTVTITGTAKFDWSKGWLYVGREAAGNGTLIFKDATITSDEASLMNGTYGIHVSGSKNGNDTTNDGTVIFENSDVQLSYLINRNEVVVNGGNLYVGKGFYIHGRKAAESDSGTDETAIITIKNGAVVTVDKNNGTGIGGESYGLMKIEGATFKALENGFTVKENSNILISGNSVISANVSGGGVIEIAAGTSLTASTIAGEGTVKFNTGVTNFYGANSVTTKIDGSVSDFDLVINENATLLITRYTLGYGRDITVNGNIEDVSALTAEELAAVTPSLSTVNGEGFSLYGSSESVLTVKNAYVDLGNTSLKRGAIGSYTWNFENAYVAAKSLGNYNAAGEGGSWTQNYKDSVVAANYLKSGVGVTQNFTDNSVVNVNAMRIDGTLNIDATSEVNVAAYQNNKKGAQDEHGDICGTINVAGTLNINASTAMDVELYGAELNVNGGTLNLGENALVADADSTVKVTVPGTIAGKAISAVNNLIIDASELTGTDAVLVIDLSGTESLEGKVTVTNAAAIYDVNGDVSVYIPVYIDKNGNNTVDAGEGYATVEAAVAGAEDGDTVVVLAYIAMTDKVVVENKSVTITAESPVTISTSVEDAFEVTSGGTLTLGEKITVESDYGAILYANGGTINVNGTLNATNTTNMATAVAANYGKIEIGSTGNVTSTRQGGYNLTAMTDGTVIINGTVTSNSGCAAQAMQNGNVIINTGAVVSTTETTGKVAVYAASGGVVTINGGEISSASGYTLCAVANGTINMTGGKVNNGAIAYEGENAVINISDGIVNGQLRADEGKGTIAVSGGSFDRVVPANCCAVGYSPVTETNADGRYEVALGYILNVEDGTNFASIADALAHTETGETLRLLQDHTESTVIVNKGITLDLNGHTLTADYVVVFKNNNLVDNGETKGLLVVDKNRISLHVNNEHMPVWNGVDGYVFTKVNANQMRFNSEYTGGLFKVDILPGFGKLNSNESVATTYFMDGASDNAIEINVRMSWTNSEGNEVYQTFVYSDSNVQDVYQNGTAFSLKVNSMGSIQSVQIRVIVISEAGVQEVSDPLTYSVVTGQ